MKMPHMQQYIYSFLRCSSAETLRKNDILATSKSRTNRIIQDKMRRSHLSNSMSNIQHRDDDDGRRRVAVRTNMLSAQTRHAEQHDAA